MFGGDEKLYDRLPRNSTGLCALVILLLPVFLYPTLAQDLVENFKSIVPGEWERTKRSINIPGPDPIYIDSIGIPQEVRDEYKLADQVAGGFESVLIWITPNKNIDRINYIHYNVQRLINYTTKCGT